MINGIDKKRISERNSNVKVRYFNGALVEDMFYNLVPLLRKNPSALILHVGTNNKVSDSFIKRCLEENQVVNILYQNQ